MRRLAKGVTVDNRQQYQAIRRYHQHLARCGCRIDLETAARLWITRYARLWRAHANRQHQTTH